MTPLPLDPGELLRFPTSAGAYRWWYLDVTAGDLTAVAIFMVGAPFSAGYSVRGQRGAAPLEHSAVNFALYSGGRRRLWVLSEYGSAHVDGDGALRIGASRWWYRPDGSVRVAVAERPVHDAAPVRAELELFPSCPSLGPIALVEGQPHHWCPVAVRATARVRVAPLEIDACGNGYHDANWGQERLGVGLPRWRWTRTHSGERTQILYEPHGGLAVRVVADERSIAAGREPPRAIATRRTAWALRVPRDLGELETSGTSAELSAPSGAPSAARTHLLESSPFYARLERRQAGLHVLSEVADFRRFHHPAVRWMADWRTRHEAGA